MKIHVISLAIACAASTAHAAGARISHVPPAEATAGTAVALIAGAPPASATLVVHYRAHRQTATEFAALELVRKDGSQWVAIVPATAVTAPGLDYYITAGDQPVFASASWPHTMPVTVTAAAERRSRDLVRVDNRRSRVNTSFELVEFGTTQNAGVDVLDRYYRIDADFSYRLLAYPLEELRVGYTRLCGDKFDCSDKGFKVGGWFELGLGVVEGVRVDGRVMVMATEEGFALGGRVEGRLGVRDGSHIAMGIETLADVGTSGFFRLGWGTVPETPMAATVEITQIPDDARESGVRLYYDIARNLGGGFRAGLRVGYAARNQNVAGFTGGLNALVDF